jgi:luciferase family oxidoreductase group 1
MLLNPDPRASEMFPQQVRELQAWVSGQEMPEGHAGRGIQAFPRADTAPQLWMLGSSDYGAQLAAHFGLPYAFAHFITDGAGCAEALELYRHLFQPGLLARPQANVCVWALAADTEEEAWRLFPSRERTRVDRQSGRFGPLLPPDEAVRPYSDAEEAYRQQLRRKALVGTGEQVAGKLLALADELQVEEVVVITWTWDPQAQRRSYELLAQACGLQAVS